MTRLRRPVRKLTGRLMAATWALRGRRRLRQGRIQDAIADLSTSLAHRPAQFRPLVDLSIAYLIARDLPKAHRALAEAREASPERFEARAGRLLARWGFPLEVVFRMAVTPRPEPVHQSVVRRGARSVTASNLPYGDCVDLDEYARFRAMPPISRAEIEQIDWNEVLGDLLEE